MDPGQVDTCGAAFQVEEAQPPEAANIFLKKSSPPSYVEETVRPWPATLRENGCSVDQQSANAYRSVKHLAIDTVKQSIT